MRADFFVHPDFYNRVRNKSLDEVNNPIYLAYLKEVRERMLSAEFGLLAYHTLAGRRDLPDTSDEYLDLFSKKPNAKVPTKYGSGEPFDKEADRSIIYFLSAINPERIIVHGSYAHACVKDMVDSLRHHYNGQIIIGTVLSRHFGDVDQVPHDRFLDMHPQMADFVEPELTRVYGVRYL
jgi:hypothetical protein